MLTKPIVGKSRVVLWMQGEYLRDLGNSKTRFVDSMIEEGFKVFGAPRGLRWDADKGCANSTNNAKVSYFASFVLFK